ncbi:polysaccharide pyruvyl transferase family protein [Isoptericola sp. b441]|uniref:Polysaccharide pyruvyl transferase family protein n=1 Tax=Actinotalea lenta TaxID=3064654 RepID=A0ABT9D7H2_9CELL|nr:polysaccharide pyruvyl transferase family protein [Isoptericola sp. b441]MDO8106804.1 polysaccharide pyruvyl transferase family protein [Isoptericola sp. b441]
MRILVLWADDVSPNLGVRALGQGTAALVRQVWPEAEVSFQNFGRGPSPLPFREPRTLVREAVTHRYGLVRWLGGFDLILDTRSGDSFADIYGIKRLLTMSTVAELAARAGTPLVLAPQTIGPFGTKRGQLLGRRSLRTASVVMARDAESAEAAARAGRPVDVHTTDVVFALPAPPVARSHDVLLNVSGLLWNPGPHIDAERYRATVRAVADGLVAEGREVALLAHVLESPSADNDVPAATELGRELGLEVLLPTNLDEVRLMVGGAALVVGSRMHACLNALSMGTAAIPLAYSRKFAPLLDELGWPHTIDLRSSADPAEAVVALARTDLDRHVAKVRTTAGDLLRPALDALRSAS